jgi:hypothetical protein
MIDEVPADGDTSYDESGATGDRMGVTFPALDAQVAQVLGVIFVAKTRKTDAGICTVQVSAKSGASEAPAPRIRSRPHTPIAGTFSRRTPRRRRPGCRRPLALLRSCSIASRKAAAWLSRSFKANRRSARTKRRPAARASASTSTPTVGNLVIAFAGFNATYAALTRNSAFWSLGYASFDGGDSNICQLVLYRYVQSGDTAALAPFLTAGSSYWAWTLYEISGVSGAWDNDVFAVYGRRNSKNRNFAVLPAITAPVAVALPHWRQSI